MAHYLPSTEQERQAMLAHIGAPSMEALFEAVPEALRLRRPLAMPQGQGEMAVRRQMEALAARNTVFGSVFRGAGAYRHYIPAIVRQVASKEAFVTAYTPYQPEISQGVLQAIFEFQSMVCRLADMDSANASVYDGPTAAAEAVAMCRERGRVRALVSAAVMPDVLETVRTYALGTDAPVDTLPLIDGATDLDALRAALGPDVACVYVQQPNYLGIIEDVEAIAGIAHAAKVKLIVGFHPIAAAMLRAPGACGADIAVAEGQPLGMPLSFGGPYLGLMACKQPLTRRLPGRIVGQTEDVDGKRAFVLTLQAREQHIRREKASSSICSNQALCALTAGAYLAAMGPEGLYGAASQCYAKAHYLQEALCAVSGFRRVYAHDFFHEFVTTCPIDAQALLAALEARGILGGMPVAGGILWCCTEMNTRAEMDALVAAVKEVCA